MGFGVQRCWQISKPKASHDKFLPPSAPTSGKAPKRSLWFWPEKFESEKNTIQRDCCKTGNVDVHFSTGFGGVYGQNNNSRGRLECISLSNFLPFFICDLSVTLKNGGWETIIIIFSVLTYFLRTMLVLQVVCHVPPCTKTSELPSFEHLQGDV